jgi:hypothetical protein
MTIERLHVMWRVPDRGNRLVVGELSRDPRGYHFQYGSSVYRDDLARARDMGFPGLPAFPLDATGGGQWSGSYLFPTFAQRIPSPTRPDFRAILADWGIDSADDPFEVLARSGGLQRTDRIEVSEYRDLTDPLDVPLRFRVAAASHVDPAGSAGEVQAAGDQVSFVRDLVNPVDPHATMIVAGGGRTLGYVPRQYAPVFARLIDSGASVTGTAERRLPLREDVDRWLITAQRAA